MCTRYTAADILASPPPKKERGGRKVGRKERREGGDKKGGREREGRKEREKEGGREGKKERRKPFCEYNSIFSSSNLLAFLLIFFLIS